MADIDTAEFRVKEGDHLDLVKAPTRVDPFYKSKAEYRQTLRAHVKDLSDLQYQLYASNQYALLIIFQAMDAAGKDGAIKHVMSGVNPQGTEVQSFKHPSPQELEHDFLWRTTQHLPDRGQIGIFNRSYYEEVLVVRVHPEILEGEGIPDGSGRDHIWHERYDSIRNHERHLHRNGTRIIKFFLHISREEQKKRFISRIDHPKKNWKFSTADIEERKYWPQYMEAYETCLSETSSDHAPWYVVPADDKKNARLIVSKVILETIASLDVTFPRLTPERLEELKEIRERLENEK